MTDKEATTQRITATVVLERTVASSLVQSATRIIAHEDIMVQLVGLRAMGYAVNVTVEVNQEDN